MAQPTKSDCPVSSETTETDNVAPAAAPLSASSVDSAQGKISKYDGLGEEGQSSEMEISVPANSSQDQTYLQFPGLHSTHSILQEDGMAYKPQSPDSPVDPKVTESKLPVAKSKSYHDGSWEASDDHVDASSSTTTTMMACEVTPNGHTPLQSSTESKNDHGNGNGNGNNNSDSDSAPVTNSEGSLSAVKLEQDSRGEDGNEIGKNTTSISTTTRKRTTTPISDEEPKGPQMTKLQSPDIEITRTSTTSSITPKTENNDIEIPKSPAILLNVKEESSKIPNLDTRRNDNGLNSPRPMEVELAVDNTSATAAAMEADSSDGVSPPEVRAPVHHPPPVAIGTTSTEHQHHDECLSNPPRSSSSISPPAPSRVVISETSSSSQTQMNQSLTSHEVRLQRIRKEISTVDKLKIELYMEAMRVHKGSGADRKYADYWDALGRYLSSRDAVRSSDDVATNSVEGILQSFLKTKKLRRLHNAYVRALMKQSLLTDASRIRICNHVPVKWRKRVREVAFTASDDVKDNVNVNVTENTLIVTKLMSDQLINFNNVRDLQKEFALHSNAYRSTERNIVAKTGGSGGETSSRLDTHESYDSMSSRIPGSLEIDQIAHFITKKDGYCLSQSAQWIAAIAVKDYISHILKKTIHHFNNERTKTDKEGTRKRRRLSNYDMIQAMESTLSQPSCRAGDGVKLSLPDTRMAWERILSHSSLTAGITPELKKIQREMNQYIEAGIGRYERNQLNNHNYVSSTDNNRRESLNGGKNGNGLGSKNLSAMIARASSDNLPIKPASQGNITNPQTVGMLPMPQQNNFPNRSTSQGSITNPQAVGMLPSMLQQSNFPSRPASQGSITNPQVVGMLPMSQPGNFSIRPTSQGSITNPQAVGMLPMSQQSNFPNRSASQGNITNPQAVGMLHMPQQSNFPNKSANQGGMTNPQAVGMLAMSQQSNFSGRPISQGNISNPQAVGMLPMSQSGNFSSRPASQGSITNPQAVGMPHMPQQSNFSRPTSQDNSMNPQTFGMVPTSQQDQAPMAGQSSSISMSKNKPGDLVADGGLMDAEKMYDLMQKRGSFLSIGTNLSRLSSPDHTRASESVNGSLVNGENSSFNLQDLSSSMRKTKSDGIPAAIGMRRLSNGRGRGAKDLSAMIARNSFK